MAAKSSPVVRRAQRVLTMVGELHKRGYQRLRVVPAISPSGAHWRCMVTPSSNIVRTHGAHLVRWEYDGNMVATYSSGGEGNEYFGWTDRKSATARELADTFLQRFSAICEAGHGADWSYAGWFVEMLGVVEQGWLPYVYDDGVVDESHGVALICPDGQGADSQVKPRIPLPPPGEAEAGDPGW